MSLDQAAVRWLSVTIHALYAARTPPEISQAAIAAMDRRFRLQVCAFEEFDLSGLSYFQHGISSVMPLPEDTAANLHDHPIMPRLGALRPVEHLRGIVSRAALERTDYFNQIARPVGYNDHIIVRAQGVPSAVTLSICRDRIFTLTECELLQCLQPHLHAAWRRVAALNGTARSPGSRMLRLSPLLQPVGLNAVHHAQFKAYFPGWREAHGLPRPVHDWAREMRGELHQGLHARPLRLLAVKSAQGTLFFRYFPVGDEGTAELCMMEKAAVPRGMPHGADLSPREREVWQWIAQGKRDYEIGVILGLSARTVGKHVEHVLAKLHVTNRTAAAGAGRLH